MCWFVGGDQRACWTVDFLRKEGLPVCTYGVPGWEDHVLPEKLSLLVLPFPVPDPWERIGDLIDRIHRETFVVGGRIGSYRALLERTGARVRDIYGTEPLTTLNAVATAEGALALLIRESGITLWESNCLVIGGGRIGMLLGERLRDLGARVTVAARSQRDHAMIRGRGMRPEKTGFYDRGLAQYDFIINTVPAPVLEKNHLEQVKTSCLLLELASAPGGFSFKDCEMLGLKAIAAPGVPGKFSPKTAGVVYGECILEILREEGII